MACFLSPPAPTERMAVLTPRRELAWEAKGVCNPGVVRMPDRTIGMIYPSYGLDGAGHLGFCRLDEEGRQVIAGTRGRQPVEILVRGDEQLFPDGYGDPRVSRIGASYYVWVKARNNAELRTNRDRFGNDFAHQYVGGRVIVALRTKDFTRLEYLGVHGPNLFDKNAFLHPDLIMIGGIPYLAFFHRIQYTIQVALAPTLDDLGQHDFWSDHLARLQNFVLLRPRLVWEGVDLTTGWPGSISGGAPPIKISADLLPRWCDRARPHWLLFYNASGSVEGGGPPRHRRVGAVVFTTKVEPNLETHPFEVLARGADPVLVPSEPYELNSRNGDVVFVTGAVKTLDGEAVELFYGSGDVAVSKARFKFAELVDYVLQFDGHGAPRCAARPI
jgi:predicted GH43/DUF377 family glycosyl hydrolase